MHWKTNPTRSESSWKPRIAEGDLSFVRNERSKRCSIDLGEAKHLCLANDQERSHEFVLPYMQGSIPDNAKRLLTPEEAGVSLDFRINGGFERNSLTVSWGQQNDVPPPCWIALKTFTGLQLKYVNPNKAPSLTFAFADEDAYCYCDDDPCRECIFKCKNGFVLYALFEGKGIVKLPVSRVRAQ